MKIDRLLAIVMLLLNRRQISAKELSEHFEVSQRTIYRDIEAINRSGIPITSYMGSNGGFGIMEDHKINRNFLTNKEIASILAALASVNSTIDNKQVSGALEKIKSMLKQNAEENNVFPVRIDYSSWNISNTDKEKLQLVNHAIEAKKVIKFKYINTKGKEMFRTVEPLSLILKDFSWYLNGYCRTKKDSRLFKIRRMSDVCITEETFAREALPVGELSYNEEWNRDKPLLDIAFRFSADIKVRIIDNFHAEQINFNEDGSGIVSFSFPEDEWLFELLLGFGSYIEVLEPARLRQLIKQKALEIACIY